MSEKPARLPLNLALQGGGSHGALTWGVLDALLEDGRFRFEGISGTSAGAMNAAALAHGFAQAAGAHKDRRDVHEAGCALARQTLQELWEGVGAMGTLTWGLPLEGNPWLGWMQQWVAPAQVNPLGFNPLRQLLELKIDFEQLRAHEGHDHVPKVFVSATNVHTGQGRIFTGKELSVDAVMASACLPLMFRAVEIDGESYWDGGYSGNPALHPLHYHTHCSDILLVQINPVEVVDTPSSAPDIMERMNEVTFNASLLAELRAIGFVRRLLSEGKLDPQRYKSVRMHRIDGGAQLAPFGSGSKMRADLGFVRELFALGRESAQRWITDAGAAVGKRSTMALPGH